jgi:hypothetical protein
MLQALLRTDLDLGGQSVVSAEHRGANDRGEAGLDEGLPADDDEDAAPPGVTAARPADPVEISSLQRSA